MTITVAVDSFKGSLSTFESARAVSEGIKRVLPDAKIHSCPLADGGEGTVDAVTYGGGGEKISVSVTGPLGEKVNAEYGIIASTGTAVIEMSSAAGITLVSEKDRNPLCTTTYGVGEIILDAIERGCRKFIIGIGGSATNDGGVGMLSALGFEFLDEKGNKLCHGALALRDIKEINLERADERLKECSFNIACDVKNPLCGENGCSAIYGPQKGATPEMVKDMDKWLSEFSRLTKEKISHADENYPGCGAAGGLGFAFMAYLGGKLTSGIELVIAETGLEEMVKDSDLVITGEGRLDGQTAMGKAPIGVARLAKKYGKKTIALSGAVTDDAKKCNEHGIDAFFTILRKPCSLEEAMNVENAYKNMADTVEQIIRLYIL